MIIRILAYACDDCRIEVAFPKQGSVLNLPEGWVSEKSLYGSFPPERHICNSCVEKKEIRETFK